MWLWWLVLAEVVVAAIAGPDVAVMAGPAEVVVAAEDVDQAVATEAERAGVGHGNGLHWE